MGRLEDKVVIVTGAANGLGLATMQLFVQEGARVVGVDLAAEALAEATRPLAGKAIPVACDITDPEAVGKMVAEAKGLGGRIDGLVHYAGITKDGWHWNMPVHQFEQVIKVNLTGTFVVAQAVAQCMREQESGSIVLTASRSYLGNLGQANYAASKGGVVSLMRTMAMELGRSHVRVNAVSPGFIETQMTAAVPDKVRERAIAATPLGRTGRPEEVAQAALFLISDESSFMTGVVLNIDGGRTLGVTPA